MTINEIRQEFLSFFKRKHHTYVSPAPIVNKDDPTLMFNNAGMYQFKDLFLGQKKASYKRAVNSQPCLRVSGKHNDLEEVGLDTYHHTLFEMLGNWSFGDYFKEESIAWAWELLTEVYSLPKDRLYVTVFGGDVADNLPADEEAAQLWLSYVDKKNVLYCSKKDNFWEMGETGPCGPCSEIHVDLRSPQERAKIPGRELVNKDHPQVIEIWNLVFIQYNRSASGKLELLPEKHVDTGMGLERLAMALQHKTSTYDTDAFTPIINEIERLGRVTYGSDAKRDIAIRVIADHIRAVTVAIADGQLPTNNKAGYVIRRILRRAVRYGYSYLGLEEPFLHTLVSVVTERLQEVVPHLKDQQAFVQKVIQAEEQLFLGTLGIGLKNLSAHLNQLLPGGILTGKIAFELYDTYGFPLDLTQLIAQEQGFSVDQLAFETYMQQQKERSREDAAVAVGDWTIVREDTETQFVGYDTLEVKTTLLKYRQVVEKNDTFYQLVFKETPFYPEGGGQIGDRGCIEVEGETQPIEVIDTKKEHHLILHRVKKLPASLRSSILCKVNKEERIKSACNHSATHLLRAALSVILGDHIEQRGSLVTPNFLRFDFSHYQKLSATELQSIENLVNEKIRANISLHEQRAIPLEKAKEMGAIAQFGEKYGSHVRLITFDKDFSMELCGGTHVQATGQIGYFKITSEGALAAGVRRIEAYTGEAAEAFVYTQLQTLEEIKERLKYPKEVSKALEKLFLDYKQIQKEVEKYQKQAYTKALEEVQHKVRQNEAYSYIIAQVEVPTQEQLKSMAFALKQKYTPIVAVLATEIESKPHVAILISEELLPTLSFNAISLVKELVPFIEGGGGGQPFFATAAGKNSGGITKMLAHAEFKVVKKI